LVDVEAVLDDGRQLDLEGVVVHRLVARDVDLQRGRFGSSQIADSNRSQPQRADDFLQVRRKLGVVVPASVTEMMFCWAFSRSVRWCSLETESSSAPMPEASSSSGSPQP
jgi:hypothetical protein